MEDEKPIIDQECEEENWVREGEKVLETLGEYNP